MLKYLVPAIFLLTSGCATLSGPSLSVGAETECPVDEHNDYKAGICENSVGASVTFFTID